MRALGDRVSAIERELATLEEQLDADLLWIPNVIDPDVPAGKGEEDNPVVREDAPKPLPFPGLPHWEVGERLGILDIPRAPKLSGSRFYGLRGAGAALQPPPLTSTLSAHTRSTSPR